VAASSSEANDSMMIKCLPSSSPELFILLRLNQREFRHDPWNPALHILCAVSRDERVFLCMQRLVEFNQPPLQTVSNYIDFFRQVLEVCRKHESWDSLTCRSGPDISARTFYRTTVLPRPSPLHGRLGLYNILRFCGIIRPNKISRPLLFHELLERLRV
jgi:hypothetical protein